jgi:signal transduction histidine kinase
MEVQDGIDKAIQQAFDLNSEVRTLSHRLHSPSLDYVGLAAAASGYCSELAEQYKVKIDFHSKDIPGNLTREVALCLFRVLQEALQNAIKHSGSRHFRVSLRTGNAEIALFVRDTGTGFEPAQVFKGRGIGLSTMKERLKLVNGTVSINSGLGRGTRVHARVPLSEQSPAASHG